MNIRSSYCLRVSMDGLALLRRLFRNPWNKSQTFFTCSSYVRQPLMAGKMTGLSAMKVRQVMVQREAHPADGDQVDGWWCGWDCRRYRSRLEVTVWRHLRGIDAERLERLRHPAVDDESGGKAGGSRRALDAVATLPCEPEEALRSRIEADHLRPVGAERPETAPGVLDPGHLHGRGLLEGVNAGCQRHVIGEGIVRLDRGLVGRRDQDPARVGLEVEVLADLAEDRPLARIDAVGRRQDGDAAPERREPHLLPPGEGRAFVRPRPGGVHHDGRA